MKYFYGYMLANTGIGAAMRKAKLNLLKSNDVTRHPYDWAAFVLVGNPS